MRLALGLLLVGCTSSSTEPADSGVDGHVPPKYDPAVLAPLGDAKTTLEQTVVPKHALSSPAESRSPADPTQRDALLADGFGETTFGPAQPTLVRTPPGQNPPPAGTNAKVLFRFVHVPDIQLADDESPTRLAQFDAPGAATNAIFRAQEGHQCRILNAAVRTVNALHKKTPLSFLLLGGDNADNAQQNEIDWVLSILGGSDRVECDSGQDDDPIAGANNDGKDPFKPEGLAFPFYWVTGNHDILVQGTFPVIDSRIQIAKGDSATGGTRDYRLPGAPVTQGPIPTDAARAPLVRADIMKRVAAHGTGHGIGPSQVQSGKAFYTFDVAQSPVRFVVLDTSAETGASEGVIRKGDLDSVIRPMLETAKADGKVVFLASHHAVAALGDGSGLGGTTQADAVTQKEWTDFIGGYSNVVYSIVGHSHANRVQLIEPAVGHAFWEVMTSALADYPFQVRVLELHDDDNGFLRLHTMLVDYSAEGDPVAAEGRRLGVLDYTSGWGQAGQGTTADGNVDLVIPKP